MNHATFDCFFVAASVSERTDHHSLTLAATTQPRRSKLRGIEPIENESGSVNRASTHARADRHDRIFSLTEPSGGVHFKP